MLEMEGSSLEDQELPDAKRPRRSVGLPVLATAAHTVECQEGKSTLLEVKVLTQDSDLQYQWLRNGEAITEELDDAYYYVTRPVLDVDPVSLAMEKYTYSCNVTNSEGTVESEPIQLTVKSALDQYADAVKSKNAILPAHKQNELAKMSVSIENIKFNLSLVQAKKKIRFNKESTCYTLQGFDDVMKEKLSIEYEEVFNDLEAGARVLLLGRPGSGKSTLSQRITIDWAKNNLKINAAKLVFPVCLRACSDNPTFELSNILERYFDIDSAMFSESLKCIAEREGEGVCFLLDGLEDYSMSKKDAFLTKLLKGETLSKSVVIITSRPSAAVRLQSLATRQVEILGLSNSEIHEYVRSYPFSRRNRASKMSAFLEDHPNIMSMCYLPYQLEIVAHLYDELENKLPRTSTKIYEAFCIGVLRQVTRKGVRQRRNFKYIEDLQPHEAEMFAKLCKLAYTATTSGKRLLRSKQLAKIFGDDSTFLGLLSQDLYSAHQGNPNVFTFLNPTLQQYLAAVHITSLPGPEQTKVIKKLSTTKRLEPVIAFYFGSVTPDDIEGSLKSVLECTENKTAFHVQCVFEAQNPALCDQLINHNSKHIKFFNCFLPPTYTTALAYVLGCNTSTGIAITLKGVSFGLDSTKAFVQEAKRHGVLKVEKFFFHHYRCSEHTMNCMVAILKQLETCKEVSFSYTKLNVGKVKILTRDTDLLKKMVSVDVSECHLRCAATKLLLKGLKHCTNLKVLRMNNNDMNLAGVKAVAKFFSDHNNLSELNIKNFAGHCIRYQGDVILAEGLKHLTHLKVLNIAIGVEGCRVLAEGLTRYKMLEVFSIACNGIGDEGVKVLMGALKNCTTIRSLNISVRGFGNDGTKAIATNLKSLPNLETLILCSFEYYYHSSMRISSVGAEALADNLQYCHNLQTLDLSHTGINEHAESLCRELRHCTQLHTLLLSGNYRDHLSAGAAACLGESLKFCPNMKFLRLDKNNLSNVSTVALAEGLKCCTHLQELELQHNDINVEGGVALADALEGKLELGKLDLSYNKIGEGIKALASSLASCQLLRYCSVCSNGCTSENRKHLKTCIPHCTTILSH